jgi:hypothetical protein
VVDMALFNADNPREKTVHVQFPHPLCPEARRRVCPARQAHGGRHPRCRRCAAP